MATDFTIHKARHGDCILIRTADCENRAYNVLIDGGPSPTYEEALRDALSSLYDIHLLVLTHIDSDHIGGLIKLLKSRTFHKITIHRYWFNARNLLNISQGTDISMQQARDKEDLLIQLGEPAEKYNDIVSIEKDEYKLAPGIKATIFSPNMDIVNILFSKWPELSNEPFTSADDEEISSTGVGVRMPELSLKQLSELPFYPAKKVENDIFNASSIAFLLELPDCRLLLLGDARPELLVSSLLAKGYSTNNKLEVDYVKISHHGSHNNTSNELLELIACSNFIISTNGGAAKHKHPDRDVIARIIYHPGRNFSKQTTIFFNYSVASIEKRKGPVLLPADKLEGNWLINDDTCKFTI